MILQIKNIGWTLLLASLLMTSCAGSIAKFSVQNETPTALEAITFSNETKKADAYEWSFGDGKTSTEVTPTHTYFRPGEYAVTLKTTYEGKTFTREKMITVKPPKQRLVEIETRLGTMLIMLYDQTPLHRDNFVKLAKEGYYDGTIFHRVINGFMIQGGDPDSKNPQPGRGYGMGGPGYQIPAEIGAFHFKGALAAARTGGPQNPEKKSSGSQFYIVQGKKATDAELNRNKSKGITYSTAERNLYKERGGTSFLDGEYTVYGEVIEGLDVVDKIAQVATDRSKGDRPVEDVIMKVRLIN